MSVKKRGKGWLITIYLGRDATGKKKYYYETFYSPTKSLAKERELELIKLRRVKIGPNSNIKTVGDLLEYWYNTIASLENAGEHTLSVYAWHIRRLKPIVGHLNLYDLTAFDIQNALKGQFFELAKRTRKNFYSTLKTALRNGYGWGLLATDVTNGIIMPVIKTGAKDKPILSFAELGLLLEAARNYKHHLIVRLLVVTGARLSEVLGLRWQDIDFVNGIISFKQSVDSRRRKVKDLLKTKNAYRSIRLDEETIAYLQQHKQKQQTGKKVVSINTAEQLIFLADDGRAMRHRAVELTFKRALKKAGLPIMGLHCLRHSAASGLYDLDISVADIIALTGHANYQSLDNYIHSKKVGLNILDTLEQVTDKKADN